MRKSKSTGRFKWANFLNRFRLRLLESISRVHEFFNFLFLTPAMKFGESYGRWIFTSILWCELPFASIHLAFFSPAKGNRNRYRLHSNRGGRLDAGSIPLSWGGGRATTTTGRRFTATNPNLKPEHLKRREFQESSACCPKIRDNSVAHRKKTQVRHRRKTAFTKTSHTVGIEYKSVQLRELSSDVKLAEMQRPHVQNFAAQALREDIPEIKTIKA